LKILAFVRCLLREVHRFYCFYWSEMNDLIVGRALPDVPALGVVWNRSGSQKPWRSPMTCPS
jgi:hypothetical protein